MYDSAGILKICMDFYWIRMDSLQFPLMSLGFHLMILSYPMNFLDFLGFLSRSYGRLWIYLDSVSISIDFHKFPSQFLLFFLQFQMISVGSHRSLSSHVGFLWISYGILWICLGLHAIPIDFFLICDHSLWISLDLHPIPTAFLLICVHFLLISLDFHGCPWSGDFCRIPSHFLAPSTPVCSWACQRRPQQSFTKASRKRASRMPCPIFGVSGPAQVSPGRPQSIIFLRKCMENHQLASPALENTT